MTRQLVVHVEGVDHYCPTCRRRLVTVHPDGTFDLAGKASAQASGDLDDAAGGQVPFLVVDATCHRWRCALRRALRWRP